MSARARYEAWFRDRPLEEGLPAESRRFEMDRHIEKRRQTNQTIEAMLALTRRMEREPLPRMMSPITLGSAKVMGIPLLSYCGIPVVNDESSAMLRGYLREGWEVQEVFGKLYLMPPGWKKELDFKKVAP